MRIMGLLATFIHMGFTIVIDSALLCGYVGGPLNRCMPFKHLTLFLIIIAGVRGVVTRRRSTIQRHLAEATTLGGLGHILPMLGPFLVMRIHPGIGDIKERSTT
jgi:hypothetical protein